MGRGYSADGHWLLQAHLPPRAPQTEQEVEAGGEGHGKGRWGGGGPGTVTPEPQSHQGPLSPQADRGPVGCDAPIWGGWTGLGGRGWSDRSLAQREGLGPVEVHMQGLAGPPLAQPLHLSRAQGRPQTQPGPPIPQLLLQPTLAWGWQAPGQSRLSRARSLEVPLVCSAGPQDACRGVPLPPASSPTSKYHVGPVGLEEQRVRPWRSPLPRGRPDHGAALGREGLTYDITREASGRRTRKARRDADGAGT